MTKRETKRRAKQLLEMDQRATIARLTNLGYSAKQIAEHLGTTPAKVAERKKQSMERVVTAVISGEVLEPRTEKTVSPEERKRRRLAYDLRKRAIPFPEIATTLQQSESLVRQWVSDELVRLDNEDITETQHQRRMQLERYDMMMAAIMTPATGIDITGARTPPNLDAMDRMLKIMDKQNALLGLDAPTVVDINHRIEILAIEQDYNPDDLKEIAKEVIKQRLQARQLKAGYS
jgi:hypothetical protein